MYELELFGFPVSVTSWCYLATPFLSLERLVIAINSAVLSDAEDINIRSLIFIVDGCKSFNEDVRSLVFR